MYRASIILTQSRLIRYLCVASTCLFVLGGWPDAGQVVAEIQSINQRWQGVLRPCREVELTAELPGILEQVSCKEGTEIKAGQVLAKMDDALQQLQVESAELQAQSDAAIEQQRLQLQETKIVLNHVKESRAQGGASEWEERRATLDLEQAEVGLKEAQEQKKLLGVSLRLEQQALQRYRVMAPFDGKVVEIQAEQGATLGQGDPILTCITLNPLEAELYLPVRLWDDLVVGKPYPLIASQPAQDRVKLIGTLESKDERIDTSTQSFRCILSIPNPDSKFLPGFSARLGEGVEASGNDLE